MIDLTQSIQYFFPSYDLEVESTNTSIRTKDQPSTDLQQKATSDITKDKPSTTQDQLV